MRSFFIFDVESVGLHGEGFAVAGGIYLENGAPQSEFCFCCPLEIARGEEQNRKWVNENVPVMEITHRSLIAMRGIFWDKWLKAKEQYPGITMAAECSWPVEASFLSACVADFPQSREWEGPYPLHDIASFLLAAGMDPMATYERSESAKPAHNPLADARHSADLLAKCFSVFCNG